MSEHVAYSDRHMYFLWRCLAQLLNIGHPETFHSFLLCPHLTQSNYHQEGVLVVLVGGLLRKCKFPESVHTTFPSTHICSQPRAGVSQEGEGG